MSMGQGWRLFSETAKQKWGMSMEKNFRASSNARNEAMFKEATTFAAHLRQVEKDLGQWQRDIETSFTDFRSIMLSALPRVYEEGHNGQAVPSEPEPSMIGGDVQVERLTSAAQETKKRLDMEVVQPIRQWMVAYRTIQERMKRLEALRLELDSRRRTVADLQGRCERLRANLGTTRARGEVDMEITLRKMQHKEDKMQRTQAQFGEMEQTVYNSLFTLIKDTCVLRDYAAAAILILQESFQAAHAAFEPQLPQYSTSAAVHVMPNGVQQQSAIAAPIDNKYDPKSLPDKYGAEQAPKAKASKGSTKGGAASGIKVASAKQVYVTDEGDHSRNYNDQSYEYSHAGADANNAGGQDMGYGSTNGNRYWATNAAAAAY